MLSVFWFDFDTIGIPSHVLILNRAELRKEVESDKLAKSAFAFQFCRFVWTASCNIQEMERFCD